MSKIYLLSFYNNDESILLDMQTGNYSLEPALKSNLYYGFAVKNKTSPNLISIYSESCELFFQVDGKRWQIDDSTVIRLKNNLGPFF